MLGMGLGRSWNMEIKIGGKLEGEAGPEPQIIPASSPIFIPIPNSYHYSHVLSRFPQFPFNPSLPNPIRTSIRER